MRCWNDPRSVAGFLCTVVLLVQHDESGTFGVDVRNSDGLIVVSDMTTGIWTFRMDGFSGWNGESWGMPDISSVQKWDTPLKPRPVS